MHKAESVEKSEFHPSALRKDSDLLALPDDILSEILLWTRVSGGIKLLCTCKLARQRILPLLYRHPIIHSLSALRIFTNAITSQMHDADVLAGSYVRAFDVCGQVYGALFAWAPLLLEMVKICHQCRSIDLRDCLSWARASSNDSEFVNSKSALSEITRILAARQGSIFLPECMPALFQVPLVLSYRDTKAECTVPAIITHLDYSLLELSASVNLANIYPSSNLADPRQWSSDSTPWTLVHLRIDHSTETNASGPMLLEHVLGNFPINCPPIKALDAKCVNLIARCFPSFLSLPLSTVKTVTLHKNPQPHLEDSGTNTASYLSTIGALSIPNHVSLSYVAELQHLPHLHSLTIHHCSDLTDHTLASFLASVLESFPVLCRIELYRVSAAGNVVTFCTAALLSRLIARGFRSPRLTIRGFPARHSNSYSTKELTEAEGLPLQNQSLTDLPTSVKDIQLILDQRFRATHTLLAPSPIIDLNKSILKGITKLVLIGVRIAAYTGKASDELMLESLRTFRTDHNEWAKYILLGMRGAEHTALASRSQHQLDGSGTQHEDARLSLPRRLFSQSNRICRVPALEQLVLMDMSPGLTSASEILSFLNAAPRLINAAISPTFLSISQANRLARLFTEGFGSSKGSGSRANVSSPSHLRVFLSRNVAPPLDGWMIAGADAQDVLATVAMTEPLQAMGDVAAPYIDFGLPSVSKSDLRMFADPSSGYPIAEWLTECWGL